MESVIQPSGRVRVTAVVPTRNEARNVAEVYERLARTCAVDEVIFVDDSDDETPAVVRSLGSVGHVRPVGLRLLHRPAGQRNGGLGAAVAAGFAAAEGALVTVIDGDLQHPPELLPLLAGTIDMTGVDVVIASRYCAAGSADGLDGLVRTLVSRGSVRAAKAMFPRATRRLTDPMSGYFLVRREAVDVATLRPDGFKILLEILIRQRPLTVAEVPLSFAERAHGDSKGSLKEGARFGRQLVRLRLRPGPGRAQPTWGIDLSDRTLAAEGVA